ncbi:RsmE family RNA methyltransferase [Salibacterium qingdaonense]|uniref:Ribosomal RNA small subunit methyltransferase E n=1 Tax=Salibacterium qingdaonense TaxID=266892 RepID=A0A1I4JIX1_9BACI|nr:RsmE family RNA methyltransferase [Salibacterium qingdaonense]SFL66143.1 16S rRNA (uracil1498-N3)-methyltransferase [Salibacterium qingdaonense]
MQRYFVKPEQMTENDVVITGEDVKHISKVVRLEPGSHIECLNNQGRRTHCRIRSVDKESVAADILEDIESSPELPVYAAVAQALIKGDNLDLVVQKGTELGARSFLLFAAGRSVVKWDSSKVEKKLQRLRKIAKEAAEQSGRQYIPDISYYASTRDMMEEASTYEASLYLDEETAKSGEHHAAADIFSSRPASILALIGPEGGISRDEAQALDQSGCRPVSLGPRILRSESASLYFLSALSYHYEILR